MVKCELCEKECGNDQSFSNHIQAKHKIRIRDYYLKYVNPEATIFCAECGKETKFLDFRRGFQKYCGLKCVGASFSSSSERKELFRKSYMKNNMKEIQAKREKTNFERYGNKCANNVKEIQDRNFVDMRDKQIVKVKEYLKLYDIELAGEYKNNRQKTTFKCLKCGKEFQETYDRLCKKKCKCPYERERSRSAGEEEILQFILEYEDKIFSNTPIGGGYELDIFIPEKNLAFEYCGLYWHSEKRRRDPQNCHNIKLKMCNEINVKLIQIFEDEWVEKRDIVQSRIINALDRCSHQINSKKCSIKLISELEKKEFLENNHLNGDDSSIIFLGAYYKNMLVAVMTFVKEDHNWKISRFCFHIGYQISKIYSKFLDHFKKNYKWKEIIEYTDRRWNSGKSQIDAGFELESITEPNCWYTKNGYTRMETPTSDKCYRIWDCGNMKFVMRNPEVDRTK